MILKNKWSNQNFREMYIWRRTPWRQARAAAPHGVKSLPQWGTAAGRRGARTLPPGGRVFLIFFSFSILKHFEPF
jgi:hypothetical protein